MINGHCDDKFKKIYEIFSDQLDSGHELGCSVAIEYEGKEVVNLYGGHTNPSKNTQWNNNTLVNVWSVTKAVTGICVTKIINDGILDVDKKVLDYWPEYGINNPDTKVIDLLTHRAGMFGFKDGYPVCSWNDWDVFVKALESQKPYYKPGSSQGYHALTFSWLVGEIFRRAEGRMVGDYFREEIASPFNLDFHIGLSEDQHYRCADISFKRFDNLKPPLEFIKYIPSIFLPNDLNNLKSSIVSQDFTQAFNGDLFNTNDPNSIDWRRAQVPAANGHGTAASLAKLFGILSTGCERDNIKLLDISTLKTATSIKTAGPDTVLFGSKINFGLCFMLNGNETNKINFAPMIKKYGFGHAGIGGSVAYGDIENKLGYAFVCNRQQKTSDLYKTSNMLTEALYQIIS